MNGYLELHGSELLIITALFIGVAIGLWCGRSLGKEERQPRDARGRYVKA